MSPPPGWGLDLVRKGMVDAAGWWRSLLDYPGQSLCLHWKARKQPCVDRGKQGSVTLSVGEPKLEGGVLL